MTAENNTAEVFPDDFAAFQAMREGTKAPSEDSQKESETADESETTDDQEPEAEEPDTDEEDGDEGDDEEEEDDKPKSKRGISKRFRELTQKIRGLEQQLKSKEPEAKPEIAKPEASEAPAGKPQASQFSTYEDYTEALTEWKIEQREARKEAEAKQREVSDAWETKLEKARKLHKDFDQKVLENDKVEVSGAMKQAIFEADRGPEVAYYLATNPKESKRIAQLSATAAIRAIGKIEDGLAPLQKAPQPKIASKAPEPIEPVSRPAKVTPKKKPLGEVDDFEEYYKRRSAGER